VGKAIRGGGTLAATVKRDQLPPHKTATFVMQRWKAVYVSVNKAACTSLKWLVADLQGEDPEQFHRSLSRELTRTMTIHRRSLWRKTPMAKRLSDERLERISPENGWFVFAVVRHPTARLFSAWQSKLLLREPWWVDQFGGEEWFPRVPESGQDIVDEFVRFVRTVVREPGQDIMRNRHFAPQGWMLAADRMPYTRIYKTSEIGELLTDFEEHLRGRGYDGGPLKLLRANETPLKPIASLFPPDVLDAARTLCGDDFERFGYDDVMPGGLDPADRYDDAVLPEIIRLIERAERINDLALRAREFKAEVRAADGTQPVASSPIQRIASRAKRRLVSD
jgi:sulfotransferase famil protein